MTTKRYIALWIVLPLTYEPEELGIASLDERRQETVRLLARAIEHPEDIEDAQCYEVEVME